MNRSPTIKNGATLLREAKSIGIPGFRRQMHNSCATCVHFLYSHTDHTWECTKFGLPFGTDDDRGGQALEWASEIICDAFESIGRPFG